MKTLVWFRNDLRVDDNPALCHARERGTAVAVFFWCERQWRAHDVGERRLAFLFDSLHALAADLRELGIPLLLAREPWFDGVPRRLVTLARQVGATTVACNDEYPLNERRRDARAAEACAASGIEFQQYHAGTLLPPGSVLSSDGEPYTVFTPFKRRWLAQIDAGALRPLPRPQRQTRPAIEEVALPDRVGVIRRDTVGDDWPGGSVEAHRRLAAFMRFHARHYEERRDYPAWGATSGLSPYLSAGTLSARHCLRAAVCANGGHLRRGDPGLLAWINELIWRDFYRHVIARFPHVSRGRAFRRDRDRLPWRDAPDDLAAWKAGETGFPLVDAAMRQLAETGWMHNRLRMLSAMFLSKHLLLDWRLGERHFMQHLVDGDFAANNGGWQWSASTGTDAAPYFRIFNPFTQARRFDPDGAFIRRHVPELSGAPTRALLDPARHPTPGYATPIVDHYAARRRALETFRALSRG